ncbi:MAG TPA: protein kinase [Vicinamibacterales bacterium]|nr:protein kinase [Vicinamibacterales bacterium]
MKAGDTLGPYQILAKLGEGGMGEMYRATDTNLARQVAIKVLPDAVASDAERLARFDREAKTLAALNHPRIAAIYGLEKSGGQIALVMELVEGLTLADRIVESPVPVDEAILIAKQIAEALEAAHEQGIVHRDLKPANIKLRPDGTVKVLDFGLAKAMEPRATSSSQSNLPTITTPAMTRAGLILGTAAYMSPEQARGRPVDRRADIWALGTVLFEMLAGQRAFDGEDTTETLAAIVKSEPDLNRLPEATPARVREIIQRALTKDLHDRFQDIGDFRYELGRAAADRGGSSAPVRRTSRWFATVAGLAGAVVVTAAVTGALILWLRPGRPQGIVRLTIGPAADNPLRVVNTDPSVAISPDGLHVFYNSGRDIPSGGITRRDLDRLTALRLDGLPSNIDSPFVSPDNEWLGFDDGGARLRRVAIQGGPPNTISAIDGALRGASWGVDDTIVFATVAPATGLFRVKASGGEPELLTKPADGEGDHLWPDILPGGRGVLFTIVPAGSIAEASIALLDSNTRAYRVIVRGGSAPRYLPTGHIVYGESGKLRAVVFDLDRLEVKEPSRLVLEGVRTEYNGAAHFSVAGNGSLTYIADPPAAARPGRVVWVGRDGREQDSVTASELESPRYLRLSPDRQRLALAVGRDIWVYDLRGRPPIRLTTQGATDPLWSLDGARIFYRVENSRRSVVVLPSDGGGGEPKATSPEGSFAPRGWDRAGRTLLALHFDGPQRDIVQWSLDNPDVFEPVVRTPSFDGGFGIAMSPDGRWLAYASDRDGAQQIWVQPYPGPGVARRVSPRGGIHPVWSPNGRELFYVDGERLMSVVVGREGDFPFATATALFSHAFAPPSEGTPDYDVGSDGRFLLIKSSETARFAEPQIAVVLNWFEELKRLVPTD